MQPGAPGDSCCAAGKGLMIASMVLGIIQLIMVAWFGFIGVLGATICEESGANDMQHDAVNDFCDMMGLMTLTAIARFGLVLTITICACCGTCCGPKAPAQAATVVVQQPPVVVVTQ